MVRLRTDRWYGLDGQRRLGRQAGRNISGTRQLVSFGLLLILILLLMREAAQPQNFSRAFSALGVPLDDPASPVNSPKPAQTRTIEFEPGVRTISPEHDVWQATCKSVVPQLLQEVSTETILQLATRWFSEPPSSNQPTASSIGSSTDTTKWVDPFATETLQRLAKIRLRLSDSAAQIVDFQADRKLTSKKAQTEDEPWQSAGERFEREWESFLRELGSAKAAVRSSPQIDSTIKSVLSESLDHKLDNSLRNAVHWTSSEYVPFYRLLQRGTELSRQPSSVACPLLTTTQLAAELAPRGEIINFRGSVRRVESISNGDSTFGTPNGYWRLWLRGDDNSTQPVAIYTTDVQASELAKHLQSDSTDFPRIEVIGIVSKRLAYSAQTGIEVAPTLFAIRLHSAELLNQVAASNPLNGKGHPPANVLWILSVAVLIAAVVVVPVCSGFRKRAKPIRVTKSKSISLSSLVAWIVFAGTGIEESFASQPAKTPTPWDEPPASLQAAELLQRRLAEIVTAKVTDQLLQFFRARTDESLPNDLLRAVFVCRSFGWEVIEQFPIGKKLAAGSVMVFQGQGFVRHATVEQLSHDQRSWYAYDAQTALYRLEIELAEPKRMLTVFCESVPRGWVTSPQLRQPCEIRGLAILASAESEHGSTSEPICVIARQPIWTFAPQHATQSIAPAVHADHLQLGLAGWNLAWIDSISQREQKPLEFEESDAFYSLLDTAPKLTGYMSDTTEGLTPMLALKQPIECAGKFVRWPVRLVRGSLIQSAPREVDSQNFVAGTYYQLDGWVDIAGQRITFKLSSDSEKGELPIDSGVKENNSIEFAGEFPITLVSRTLPDEFINQAAIRAGATQWDLRQYAIAHGVFYRLWGYHSEQVSQLNSNSRQVAPLVVLTNLTSSAPPVRRVVSGTIWVNWVLCFALLGCLAVIWRFAWSDRGARRRRTAL